MAKARRGIMFGSDVVTRLEEERAWAMRCVGVWLDAIAQDEDADAPTRGDMDHSALLTRLLDGGPLMREPPPLTYGQPDYRLAEGNAEVIFDLWTRAVDSGDRRFVIADVKPGDMVAINQSAWVVVSRENDGLILAWRDGRARYRLRPATDSESRWVRATPKREACYREKGGGVLWALQLVGEPRYA